MVGGGEVLDEALFVLLLFEFVEFRDGVQDANASFFRFEQEEDLGPGESLVTILGIVVFGSCRQLGVVF